MPITLFLDYLRNSLEKKEFSIALFLDLSKAFDTVNHEILLQKLNFYGIRDKALDWFKSYLCNRKQFVFYNNAKSELATINCGVPQGSILGPTLFILYINDIVSSSKVLNFFIFADDTNILNSHKNLQDLTNITNNELKTISDWMAANKLSLNIGKTKYILFSPRGKYNKRQNLNSLILIRNKPLDKVESADFLGVTIDDQLNWKNHVNKIKMKISRVLGVLYKTRHKLNTTAMKSIYYALIQSHINYCILNWGSANKTILMPLQILQNKFVRILTNNNSRTHAPPLFKENKILHIFDVYKVNVLKFVWCCLNRPANFPKDIFKEFFKRNSQIHRYNTTRRNELHPCNFKNDYGKKSLKNQGRVVWNETPHKIQNSLSLSQLKSESIKHFIKNYM